MCRDVACANWHTSPFEKIPHIWSVKGIVVIYVYSFRLVNAQLPCSPFERTTIYVGPLWGVHVAAGIICDPEAL